MKTVLELDRELMIKLTNMHVLISVHDPETVVFRGVPANGRFFNKESTNLLIKRAGENLPFFVFVDHDLVYTGESRSLSAVFAAGAEREGWRMLQLAWPVQSDFQSTVEGALAVLGAEGQEPLLAAGLGLEPTRRGLLAAVGVNLSQRMRDDGLEPTIGRDDETDEVTFCVTSWGQKRLALIVGECGVGKSNLLASVTRRLLQRHPRLALIAVDLVNLMVGTWLDADREARLAGLLDEAAADPQNVLALEHLELAQRCPAGSLLLAQFLDRGGSLVGTTLTEYLPLFTAGPLARRLHPVWMRELTPGETADVLAALRGQMAAHHGVDIDEACIPAAVRVACHLEGVFPAKAIALLDAAASRASLAGTCVVGADDVCFAARRSAGAATSEED